MPSQRDLSALVYSVRGWGDFQGSLGDMAGRALGLVREGLQKHALSGL